MLTLVSGKAAPRYQATANPCRSPRLRAMLVNPFDVLVILNAPISIILEMLSFNALSKLWASRRCSIPFIFGSCILWILERTVISRTVHHSTWLGECGTSPGSCIEMAARVARNSRSIALGAVPCIRTLTGPDLEQTPVDNPSGEYPDSSTQSLKTLLSSHTELASSTWWRRYDGQTWPQMPIRTGRCDGQRCKLQESRRKWWGWAPEWRQAWERWRRVRGCHCPSKINNKGSNSVNYAKGLRSDGCDKKQAPLAPEIQMATDNQPKGTSTVCSGWNPCKIDRYPVSNDGESRGMSVVTTHGLRMAEAAGDIPIIVGGLGRCKRHKTIYRTIGVAGQKDFRSGGEFLKESIVARRRQWCAMKDG